MFSILSLGSIFGRPAGTFIGSQLMDAIGKHTLRARWKELASEAERSPEISPEERANIRKLRERSFLDRALDLHPEEFLAALANVGVPERVSVSLLEKMQLSVLDLAKKNSHHFMRYLVEAEQKQLDGIREIKEALGLSGNLCDSGERNIGAHRIELYLDDVVKPMITRMSEDQQKIARDTGAILKNQIENQNEIVAFLRELKDQIVMLDPIRLPLKAGAPPTSLDEDDNGQTTLDITRLLTNAMESLGQSDYHAASGHLFNSALRFYRMYMDLAESRYYVMGNRCYSLGQAMIAKGQKDDEK